MLRLRIPGSCSKVWAHAPLVGPLSPALKASPRSSPLEFKVLTENRAKEVEEKLHQLAESALQLINECDYEAELRDRDCRSIIKYGIGFYKKEFSIVKG